MFCRGVCFNTAGEFDKGPPGKFLTKVPTGPKYDSPNETIIRRGPLQRQAKSEIISSDPGVPLWYGPSPFRGLFATIFTTFKPLESLALDLQIRP